MCQVWACFHSEGQLPIKLHPKENESPNFLGGREGNNDTETGVGKQRGPCGHSVYVQSDESLTCKATGKKPGGMWLRVNKNCKWLLQVNIYHF